MLQSMARHCLNSVADFTHTGISRIDHGATVLVGEAAQMRHWSDEGFDCLWFERTLGEDNPSALESGKPAGQPGRSKAPPPIQAPTILMVGHLTTSSDAEVDSSISESRRTSSTLS